MRFRNKETGELYNRLTAIPCNGYCEECPVPNRLNGGKTTCVIFMRKYPYEAAAALGYEVIEDDAPSSELPANHPIFTNNHNNYQDNKTTVGWISVKDRLPDDEESVLILMGNIVEVAYIKKGISEKQRQEMKRNPLKDTKEECFSFTMGYYKINRSDSYKPYDEYGNNRVPYKWFAQSGPCSWFGQEVTHWMPLPEPPKEENPCSKTE